MRERSEGLRWKTFIQVWTIYQGLSPQKDKAIVDQCLGGNGAVRISGQKMTQFLAQK